MGHLEPLDWARKRAHGSGRPQSYPYDPAAPPRLVVSHRPGKKPRVERKSARPLIPAILRPLACNGFLAEESMYFTTLSIPCSGAQKDLDLTREENKNKKSIDSRSHIKRPRKRRSVPKIRNINLLEWLDTKPK